MPIWKIVRWIKEEYEVDGDTREEALKNTYDPHTVTKTKETCVKTKSK